MTLYFFDNKKFDQENWLKHIIVYNKPEGLVSTQKIQRQTSCIRQSPPLKKGNGFQLVD